MSLMIGSVTASAVLVLAPASVRYMRRSIATRDGLKETALAVAHNGG
ncbi:hypothetical protein MJ560_13430 [Klebsiella pneumoniae]|nr:hypothetical protein MJ560_13430 [Klebsiella pneumoniae]